MSKSERAGGLWFVPGLRYSTSLFIPEWREDFEPSYWATRGILGGALASAMMVPDAVCRVLIALEKPFYGGKIVWSLG